MKGLIDRQGVLTKTLRFCIHLNGEHILLLLNRVVTWLSHRCIWTAVIVTNECIPLIVF